MPKLNVYTLGQMGVNRVASPVQVKDGELLQSQNATTKVHKNQLALSKRDGMAKINSTAAAGSLLAIGNIPIADPGVIPNFSAWTTQSGVSGQYYAGIVWAPELSLFCAAGQQTSGSNRRIMTSPDGINWTSQTIPAGNGFGALAYSPDLTRFVVIANDGIYTSDDGSTWEDRGAPPVAQTFTDCVWATSLNKFVAVSSGGALNRVMTSTDGTSWAMAGGAATTTRAWTALTWSEDLGLLAAVAPTSATDQVMTSTDGSSWTLQTTNNNSSWQDITWSPERGLFAVVANADTGGAATRVMTSPDGINWTSRTPAAVQSWGGIVEANGFFVAVSATGTSRAMTSPDGINWTLQSTPTANTYDKVAWGESINTFAAVGYTANTSHMSSP